MKLIFLIFVYVFTLCFSKTLAHDRINKCVFICPLVSIPTCASDDHGEFYMFQNDCERKQKACEESINLKPVKYEHCAGVIKTDQNNQPDSAFIKPKERNCLVNKCDRFANPVCGIEYKPIIRHFDSACEMEKMGCIENKVFKQVPCRKYHK